MITLFAATIYFEFQMGILEMCWFSWYYIVSYLYTIGHEELGLTKM